MNEFAADQLSSNIDATAAEAVPPAGATIGMTPSDLAPRTTWAPTVTLVGIALLGLLLRLYRIDHQSVWFDEAQSLVWSRLGLREMTEKIADARFNINPPLHFYMLHAWFQLF